jgi:hypothetical protein
MDVLNGEPGSCDESCLTSTLQGNELIGIEAEKLSDVSEVVNEQTTIAILNTEPSVSFVPLVSFTHICFRLHP